MLEHSKSNLSELILSKTFSPSMSRQNFPIEPCQNIFQLDYYGKLLVTSTSNTFLKIWYRGVDGEWSCSSQWKAHEDSITDAAWCHPKFGRLIASCSVDSSVKLWQASEESYVSSEEVETCDAQWRLLAKLTESRCPLKKIEFSPYFLGLVLAVADIRGTIRIYRCDDFFSPSIWILQNTLKLESKILDLSWSQSQSLRPLLAIGCDFPSISYDLNSTETIIQSSLIERRPPLRSLLQVFHYSPTIGEWSLAKEDISSGPNQFTQSINSLSFSNDLGRPYHILATGSTSIRILHISEVGEQMLFTLKFLIHSELFDHRCPVLKVEWNITGYQLTSSGADDRIIVWKRAKEWEKVRVFEKLSSPIMVIE